MFWYIKDIILIMFSLCKFSHVLLLRFEPLSRIFQEWRNKDMSSISPERNLSSFCCLSGCRVQYSKHFSWTISISIISNLHCKWNQSLCAALLGCSLRYQYIYVLHSNSEIHRLFLLSSNFCLDWREKYRPWTRMYLIQVGLWFNFNWNKFDNIGQLISYHQIDKWNLITNCLSHILLLRVRNCPSRNLTDFNDTIREYLMV